MTEPDTYDDILAEIYGPRRELMRAFHFFEGRVGSKKLFDEADAPRDSKHHYLSILSELGLIEHDGWQHGQGGQHKVWQLTPRGAQVAQDVVDADTTTISDLEALEQRIRDLERRAEAEEQADYEQVEANAAAIEEVREQVETILSRLDTIAKRSNGAR